MRPFILEFTRYCIFLKFPLDSSIDAEIPNYCAIQLEVLADLANVTTVKVAAWMNKNIGTNIVMSNAVLNVARLAKMANAIGWVWMGFDVLNLLFGSSHARLFFAVNQICTQRLILASEGIPIEKYYK